MLLETARLRRLDDLLTAAHLPPSFCAHPKAGLRICTHCEHVFCGLCHPDHECRPIENLTDIGEVLQAILSRLPAAPDVEPPMILPPEPVLLSDDDIPF